MMSPRPAIIPVTALVDWNCQIHASEPPRDVTEQRVAEITLSYVGRIVSNALHGIDAGGRFDVSLRLYGGWQRGFEVTPRRKALTTVAAAVPRLSTRPSVLIRPLIEFGDRLLSAADHRLHPKLNTHLSDTLRRSIYNKNVLEEKMVDTALAADLVDLAHRDKDRWLVVVGEDDDLVPPLMIANDVRLGGGGRVAIIRRRAETSFLRFEDLRINP